MSRARVHLRPVTEENRAAVEALTVTEEQSNYVEGVPESFVEAAATPDAMPRYWALHDDERLVGFVLISDGITVPNPLYLGPYYLWRLVIDRAHQRRGYGAAALQLVVDFLRAERVDAEELLTSVTQGPASPVDFYLSQGFRRTGEIHQGEVVLSRPLRRHVREPRSTPPRTGFGGENLSG